MTALLEQEISKVSILPEREQDAFASLLLEEFESEKRWDELFSQSQDKLSFLAKEAREEYRSGKTTPLTL